MSPEHQNNEEWLLQRFNAGDREAYSRVYEQFYPFVILVARRYVGDVTAADITAEVFIRLWHRSKAFQSLTHLRASLQQTTRNLSLDFLRSEKSQTRRHEQLAYLESQGVDDELEHEIIRAGVYQLILQEISRLPDYLREVFRLAYVEGLSNEAIAQKLQLKNSTVRTKKSQALEILRGKLSGLEFALMLASLGEHFCH